MNHIKFRISLRAFLLWSLIIVGTMVLVIKMYPVISGTILTTPALPASRSTSKKLRALVALPPQPPAPLPHQHVYYLKTHQIDSHALTTILGEYCRTYDLLPLLPQGSHFNHEPPLKLEQIAFAGNVSKYDMVFNHHIYTPNMLSYLYKDTFKVTMLQQPFHNFVEVFEHYSQQNNVKYLKRIPGKSTMMEFLKHPDLYEVKGYKSFTSNRQSLDLGYDLTQGFENEDYVKQFLEETEKRFHLVLIAEYFDEGLITLKRLLNWNTEDILYMTTKRAQHNHKPYLKDRSNMTQLESFQRNLHASFSKPDIMLYRHFLIQFQQRMALEIGLAEEVIEFRDVLRKVEHFCRGGAKKREEYLEITPGKWINRFRMSPHKCRWLEMNEIGRTYYLKTRQHVMMGDKWWRKFYHEQEQKVFNRIYPNRIRKPLHL